MSNIAIVLGNVAYQNLSKLECCRADVEAVQGLLEATGKYDTICTVVDADADGMKETIRQALTRDEQIDEVFVYFSGHGLQRASEFYLCAANFDNTKPNETGLSTTELHTILRSADPRLVVKVIDACNSGTSLIKADEAFSRVTKGDLGDFIQIASCLDSQFSLTGEPLSRFTQTFCAAALRKSEGSVFYTDIISSLRDSYLGDDYQTPHFVSQGTGREIFVEEAARLASYRTEFKDKWQEIQELNEGDDDEEVSEDQRASMLQLVTDADAKFATPDGAKVFIDRLFDGIKERINSDEFTDFFDTQIEEHGGYYEKLTKMFIVRSISREVDQTNLLLPT